MNLKDTIKQYEEEFIVEHKGLGYGSRWIAKQIKRSKSYVNNVYKAWCNAQVPVEDSIQKQINVALYGTEYNPKDVAFNQAKEEFLGVKGGVPLREHKKPRVLLVDYETAPTVAATFGRWKQNIGQDNVIQEGGWILTAAYKWLGEDMIHTLHNKSDIAAGYDLAVCCDLFDLYSQADAVLAHNNQGFDHKVIQTRCLINGLPVLPSVKLLDTLVMAKKKLKFNSNRLDSIATVLGYGGKVKHSGIKMWLNVMNGDEAALNEMLHYNAVDVELLEKVYLELRRVGHTGSDYNAALFFDDNKVRCRTCGSEDIKPTGRDVTTGLSKFTEYHCNECGAVHRNRQSSTTKEKRITLLV